VRRKPFKECVADKATKRRVIPIDIIAIGIINNEKIALEKAES